MPVNGRAGGGGIERPPRANPVVVAAGAGLLWGAFAYSVLWEGTPFAVDRRFVGSVLGTIVLLPARIVLWIVREGELLAGRTFELSRTTWILGVGSAAAGAVVVVVGILAIRGLARLTPR